MFGNRVLRKIYESKGDGVREEWSRLHNEELYDLYSSPNVIRVIEWRRMKWTEHVAQDRSIEGFGGET